MDQDTISQIAEAAVALQNQLIASGTDGELAGDWVMHAMPAIVAFETGKAAARRSTGNAAPASGQAPFWYCRRQFTRGQSVRFRGTARDAPWQDGTFVRRDGNAAIVTDAEAQAVRTAMSLVHAVDDGPQEGPA
jgi:hypothetical protein